MMTLKKIICKIIEFISCSTVVVFVIYKIISDVLYSLRIAPRYDYIVGVSHPDLNKYIVSWIVFAALLALGIVIKNRPLHFAYFFLMTVSIVPSTTVYWVKNTDNTAFVLIVLYWGIFAASCIICSHTRVGSALIYEESEYVPQANDAVVVFCFVFLLVSTLYYSLKFGNLRLFVSFSDVYKYRMDSSNYMGSIDSYIFSWNTNVLLPLCLITHLVDKKKMFVCADLLIGFMSYSIYGNKYVLFQLIYIIGIWLISSFELKEYVNNVITLLISSASAIVITAKSEAIRYWGEGLLYRLLFIPTEAHNFYYDFFQTNEYLYLRQSILRRFFADPYDRPVSMLIGSNIKYNLTGRYNNLNNGMFSDAYANFGAVGVFVYPVLICLIICLYGWLMREFDATFRNALIITFLGQIISTSFFQCLLTGGLIICLMLICLLNKEKNIFAIKFTCSSRRQI